MAEFPESFGGAVATETDRGGELLSADDFALEIEDAELEAEIARQELATTGSYSFRFVDGELMSVKKDAEGNKYFAKQSEDMQGDNLARYEEAMGKLALGETVSEVEMRYEPGDTATEECYTIIIYEMQPDGRVAPSHRTEMRPKLIEELAEAKKKPESLFAFAPDQKTFALQPAAPTPAEIVDIKRSWFENFAKTTEEVEAEEAVALEPEEPQFGWLPDSEAVDEPTLDLEPIIALEPVPVVLVPRPRADAEKPEAPIALEPPEPAPEPPKPKPKAKAKPIAILPKQREVPPKPATEPKQPEKPTDGTPTQPSEPGGGVLEPVAEVTLDQTAAEATTAAEVQLATLADLGAPDTSEPVTAVSVADLPMAEEAVREATIELQAAVSELAETTAPAIEQTHLTEPITAETPVIEAITEAISTVEAATVVAAVATETVTMAEPAAIDRLEGEASATEHIAALPLIELASIDVAPTPAVAEAATPEIPMAEPSLMTSTNETAASEILFAEPLAMDAPAPEAPASATETTAPVLESIRLDMAGPIEAVAPLDALTESPIITTETTQPEPELTAEPLLQEVSEAPIPATYQTTSPIQAVQDTVDGMEVTAELTETPIPTKRAARHNSAHMTADSVVATPRTKSESNFEAPTLGLPLQELAPIEIDTPTAEPSHTLAQEPAPFRTEVVNKKTKLEPEASPVAAPEAMVSRPESIEERPAPVVSETGSGSTLEPETLQPANVQTGPTFEPEASQTASSVEIAQEANAPELASPQTSAPDSPFLGIEYPKKDTLSGEIEEQIAPTTPEIANTESQPQITNEWVRDFGPAEPAAWLPPLPHAPIEDHSKLNPIIAGDEDDIIDIEFDLDPAPTNRRPSRRTRSTTV